MASIIRSWIIRVGILAVLFAIGYAGWFAATWVSPEQVRAALIRQLQARFDDSVHVDIGEAHLRFFGGISVSQVKLTRRGESEPFLDIPNAVIHHDKQRLQQGELAIRKIEFDRPTVRLTRLLDGHWNVKGILKPGVQPPREGPLPTILLRDARLYLSDQRQDTLPPVVLYGVKCQIVNDPETQLRIEGMGRLAAADAVDSAGQIDETVLTVPWELNVRWTRATGHYLARIQIPELELGPRPGTSRCPLAPQVGLPLHENSS